MTPIRRSVTSYLRQNKYLYIRIGWESYELNYSVGYQVNPDAWTGEFCVKNSVHGKKNMPASVINRAIVTATMKIENAFAYFEARDEVPDKDELSLRLSGKVVREKITLEAAWATYIREGCSQRQWAHNTVRSIRQVQKLFDKIHPDIKVKSINAKVLQQFVERQQYMRVSEATASSNKNGYANNVISKNCAILKRFLKWMGANNYIDPAIERDWHPHVKSIEKPVIFLTWDELMKIYELDLSDKTTLAEVRDLFCFMCFTSLRFSDASQLKVSQIVGDSIYVTTQKTARNIVIDINRYSSEILSRYSGKHGERVFPYHNCKTVNEGIKKIGQLAGINSPIVIQQYYGSDRVIRTCPKYEVLSTHCGRRTFVCNALSMGIPAHVVMKWTGHRDMAALKPYIDVADDIRRSEMDKFNER